MIQRLIDQSLKKEKRVRYLTDMVSVLNFASVSTITNVHVPVITDLAFSRHLFMRWTIYAAIRIILSPSKRKLELSSHKDELLKPQQECTNLIPF